MACPRCDTPWVHLHVTEALALAGLVDIAHYTEFGRERGIYVHQAAAMFDRGTLDWESLDPVLVPYMEAYRDFLVQSGLVSQPWTHIEHHVEDPVLGYVGALDRANDGMTVDLKTGVAEWWVAVQIAAYRRCLPHSHKRTQFVLELRDDGTYRFTPTSDLARMSDREAEKLWLSVLHVAQARRLHS